MAAADHNGGYQVDRWEEGCTKPPTPFHPTQKLYPGTDVTEKVKEALKDSK